MNKREKLIFKREQSKLGGGASRIESQHKKANLRPVKGWNYYLTKEVLKR